MYAIAITRQEVMDMKKYRKKIYVCLTLSALALATGCSNKAIKANAENTENVVSSTQAENTGEASAQTVVEKAKITFSDSGAQIEGSGASYADGRHIDHYGGRKLYT
jgi:hypothetical protein